jgi:hypothetical protein
MTKTVRLAFVSAVPLVHVILKDSVLAIEIVSTPVLPSLELGQLGVQLVAFGLSHESVVVPALVNTAGLAKNDTERSEPLFESVVIVVVAVTLVPPLLQVILKVSPIGSIVVALPVVSAVAPAQPCQFGLCAHEFAPTLFQLNVAVPPPCGNDCGFANRDTESTGCCVLNSVTVVVAEAF